MDITDDPVLCTVVGYLEMAAEFTDARITGAEYDYLVLSYDDSRRVRLVFDAINEPVSGGYNVGFHATVRGVMEDMDMEAVGELAHEAGVAERFLRTRPPVTITSEQYSALLSHYKQQQEKHRGPQMENS